MTSVAVRVDTKRMKVKLPLPAERKEQAVYEVSWSTTRAALDRIPTPLKDSWTQVSSSTRPKELVVNPRLEMINSLRSPAIGSKSDADPAVVPSMLDRDVDLSPGRQAEARHG